MEPIKFRVYTISNTGLRHCDSSKSIYTTYKGSKASTETAAVRRGTRVGAGAAERQRQRSINIRKDGVQGGHIARGRKKLKYKQQNSFTMITCQADSWSEGMMPDLI
jgi:hypothetical protein